MKNMLSILLFASFCYATEFTDFINNSKCDQIIDKQVYTACYDYHLKGSKFIAYTLDGASVNQANIKKRGKFYTEKNVPKQYRSHTRDYTKSGYDRGHMASDASFDHNIKAMRKTYSMINVVPQSPTVNRRLWIKAEKYERLVATQLGTVNVINGIVYRNHPHRIGTNQISVPDAFWKMIYNDDKGFKKCFFYGNDLTASSKEDKLKDHQLDCKKLQITS
jgi:endonuclease G